MFDKGRIRRKINGNLASAIEIVGLDEQQDMYQVTIWADVAITGGIVDILIKADGQAEWEPLQKGGADYSVTLAAGGVRSFTINIGSLHGIKCDPSIQAPNAIVAAGAAHWGIVVKPGRQG